ncbi:amphiphysin [Protopterus annectens]|uniref:amphiphysin n=1 Tax=Protopterus annectens TaxID=7888 RepID=UPI001CF9C385|nr:amphiphysin [Protopterus annectens]
MADIKTGVFAKNVQKRISRAQEKVLQKLGKADETRDEQFEEYIQNFKRQETEGTRLQRELKAYLAAVKGMQEASKKLTESLHEVYEPEWYGRDDVKTVGQKCDVLWEDFHQKLVDGSLLTLDTYLGQFPDIKTRIAKRSRKLVDYDSARHHLEALQSSKRKDEAKVNKAEEEFQKAQKVFEELNTDLQEELPTLWTSRVGFYVNTFKNVSSLEAKFHKEITVLCHKLYEVMTKLGEQHADKAFTIQGAPSDSGPLRLAKTPSPPEEVSPVPSPVASPNHTLAPVASPAPARPKSPSQLRKGPPVPPLPKLTPTKELQQEAIINFFEDNFVPEISVTTPSQNEAPAPKQEETLLDLDFDPFKPDTATPIGKTQSPISQTLPWDLWTTSPEVVQPVTENALNGFTQPETATAPATSQYNQNLFDTMMDVDTAPPEEPAIAEPPSEPTQDEVLAEPSMAAEEAGEPETKEEVPASSTEVESTELQASELETESIEQPEPSTEEIQPQQEKVCVPSVVIEPASNDDYEEEEHELHEADVNGLEQPQDTVAPVITEAEAADVPQTQDMVDEGTPKITNEETPSEKTENEMTEPSAPKDMPPGFCYKVVTMHDFEAANTDELNLKRGDVVLVFPSEAHADQEAGWLTGIKETDWVEHHEINGYKGLFPENFTNRME